MTSITITVADVRPPAPGKKQASVIDSTGKRWGINPSDQNSYRQFQTYEVTRFKESFFQGKTYYTIESAVPASGMQNASPPPSLPAMKAALPGHYIAPDDQRRMDIFVCGAFNNAMANHDTSPFSVAEEDFVRLINRLKQAWKKTLGPQSDPISSSRPNTDNDDMNDSIPF